MINTLLRLFSSRAARFVFSALLLGFVLYRFDAGTIVRDILTAHPGYIFLAVLTFIFSGVLGAVQWGVLLAFHGIRPGFRQVLSRYFMGLFFNYILPGFVGGDVVRVYTTASTTGQTAQSVSSTLADRVLGLLVLVLFSVGAWVILPGGAADAALPVAIIMLLVLAGFAGVFAFQPLGNFLIGISGRILPARLGMTVKTIYDELHRLTRAPKVLVRVLALSIAIQFTRIGVHYLCGRAVGIEVGFLYFALFVPLIEIVASMPVSFGGVGVREAIAPLLFATAGVDAALVVAYTLSATAAGFTGAIPGAVAFMLDTAKRKP
jgi:glycosyltransferase 2 family protein